MCGPLCMRNRQIPSLLALSPPAVISLSHDLPPPRLLDRRHMSRMAYLLHPLLVFGLLLAALLSGDGAMPQRLQAGLFAGIWAHILLSLYIGRFDSVRTRTYLLLLFAMLAAQLAGFASFVLPWGQMAFWLASLLPFAIPRLDGALVWPSVLFALLLLDVMVMQRRAGAASRIIAVGMAALAVFVAMRGAPNLAAAGLPSLDPFDVIPHWSLRPGFSILRAVPGKAMGVAALAAACAAPLILPWIPSERFRLSRFGWLWLLNCLALAASCLWLGYLGGKESDDGIIYQSRIATLAFFVCLLGVPLLMKRFVHGMSRHPA